MWKEVMDKNGNKLTNSSKIKSSNSFDNRRVTKNGVKLLKLWELNMGYKGVMGNNVVKGIKFVT